jgi:hypothetical protein
VFRICGKSIIHGVARRFDGHGIESGKTENSLLQERLYLLLTLEVVGGETEGESRKIVWEFQ